MVHSSAIQPISTALTVSHNRILLLLDLQEGMFSGKKAVPAATQVRNNISTILNHARYKVDPTPLIIHVRNDGGSGEPDERGTPGWQLIHKPLPGEQVVDKSKNNAFAGTNLTELISKDAEIVVVGLQSDFCVRATCSAALHRGNTVLLIRGSHTTFDRLEVLHGGGITPAFKIEKEIEDELEEAGVFVLDMKDLPNIFADDR
ncbi:Isochorismatase-like protein [Thelephora terrestris]|uniref:Isochorismatase-like protein n=1 Tax=Thelephora terrestris TaxID=56493 RepID=A0A9P6HSA3_9AGAM|nr:Isochorismatase-like protein [Thelephora terrestris]